MDPGELLDSLHRLRNGVIVIGVMAALAGFVLLIIIAKIDTEAEKLRDDVEMLKAMVVPGGEPLAVTDPAADYEPDDDDTDVIPVVRTDTTEADIVDTEARKLAVIDAARTAAALRPTPFPRGRHRAPEEATP